MIELVSENTRSIREEDHGKASIDGGFEAQFKHGLKFLWSSTVPITQIADYLHPVFDSCHTEKIGSIITPLHCLGTEEKCTGRVVKGSMKHVAVVGNFSQSRTKR